MQDRQITSLTAEVKTLRGEVNRMERMMHGTVKPVYVDLNMAARLYGLGAATLRHWCNTGKLEGIAHKVMGKWLIDSKAMEKWIQSSSDKEVEIDTRVEVSSAERRRACLPSPRGPRRVRLS